MKKIAIVFSILFLSVFTLWRSKNKKKLAKHEGEIDEEMRGPRGEEMYIGSGGGRYFIRNNKKIFVGYKRQQPNVF